MKVLVVGSLNSHQGKFAPFIIEQANALCEAGCSIEYYGIRGRGVIGYLHELPSIKRFIRENRIDVVHAHFGLSGLLCCLQRLVPVVVTYHGSDINLKKNIIFSKCAMLLSSWNIFVSTRTMKIAFAYLPNWIRNKSSLVPCGIYVPNAVDDCPDVSRVLYSKMSHVLFAGAFNNRIKDYSLAKESVDLLQNVQLIELKGYSREEVYALMYACDTLLMTSKTEGSPQVVKEAMACGLPVVSTDVGDVAERIGGLDGCYITDRNPKHIADALKKALAFKGRTNGRHRIFELGLTNDLVANKLIKIYNKVLGC